MSTASVVPETRGLSGEDARTTLHRVGNRRLVVDAFQRLRVSDGFSHARSLAYLTSMLVVQGVIALVGLASLIGGHGWADVVVAAVRRVVPGPVGKVVTDAVSQAHANGAGHRWTAIVVGLVGSLVTATTIFGQVERALNRLYGVEQDRPALHKYGRAALLAVSAGSLCTLGFWSLALGRDALQPVTTPALSTAWNVVRWPLGLLFVTGAVTLVLRACPRRCQPQLSWLVFGGGIAVVLWTVVTAALALAFSVSTSFGQTYGPLAGVVALLLWSLLSSIALLYGAAVAAQLEAVRQGDPEPQDEDKVERSEPAPDERLLAHAAPTR